MVPVSNTKRAQENDRRCQDLYPAPKKNAPSTLKLVEQYALPVMRDHGMVLDRYFVAKIGPLNQVVHIWNYASLAELERIRNARDADPRWADYLAKTEGMVLSQENKIMGGRELFHARRHRHGARAGSLPPTGKLIGQSASRTMRMLVAPPQDRRVSSVVLPSSAIQPRLRIASGLMPNSTARHGAQ